MDEIKVALFGIGGYAVNYLAEFEHPRREKVRLVGAVDPFAKACAACPVYATAEELFAHCQPDLVVVASPIQLHAEQAITAFRHGCHVALEKPIAPTMQEVQDILRARDEAGKLLSVGFQFCIGKMMQDVKRDMQAGVFGKLKRMRAIVLWPRGENYYRPGVGWKGKKYDAEGRPIFDSVLENATAHYLMNMLFLGETPLYDIQCQTYRANPIETYDTAVVRAKVGDDAQALIAVSHAVDPDKNQNPMWRYEFEHAVLGYGGVGQQGTWTTVRMDDGTLREYGKDAEAEGMINLWNMVDAIRGTDTVHCTGEMAALHTRTLERLREIQPEATPFPEAWLVHKGEYTYVPGLAEALFDCYNNDRMPQWDLSAAALTKDE